MLVLALVGAVSAWAGDPCAKAPPDADGVRSFVIEAPTAFDPVGDLVSLRLDVDRSSRLVLDVRLSAVHPTVQRNDRRVQLELADGSVVPLEPEPTAPLQVELQSAVVPGMVEVDVPIGLWLTPDVAARLATGRIAGVRLLADPDHAWSLKGAAAGKVRRALACATAVQAGPPAAIPASPR